MAGSVQIVARGGCRDCALGSKKPGGVMAPGAQSFDDARITTVSVDFCQRFSSGFFDCRYSHMQFGGGVSEDSALSLIMLIIETITAPWECFGHETANDR
jgi:hypothetical protein